MVEYSEPNYDKTDVDSIYNYAKKLRGHTLREMLFSKPTMKISEGSDYVPDEVKGKFGQVLQENYFGIKNDSDSEPDFKEAGLELKSTPLKKLNKGNFVPKERLVLNIINYDTIINETWETSHFLSKNELLLLIMFLYEQDIHFLDFLIKHVSLYRIDGEDKEIIRQDWENIVKKIRAGKAHELSESDTFYLGACRKGHKEQPKRYSSGIEPAKQRAFSFKQNFLRSLLLKIENSEPIIKDIEELKEKRFEEIVYDRFRPFMGLDISEIEKKLSIDINRDAKGYYADLARRMLGIKTKRIQEFEKADVVMKIIRLKHNGIPKEDMSFPAFKFKEIAEQKWEESDFYNDLGKKFFFIIFQMDKGEKNIFFKNAMFWNISATDMAEARRVWEQAKKIAGIGITFEKKGKKVLNNLPKKSQHRVSHVRPHGKNKKDTDILPNGQAFVKSCFWLNARYLKEQIDSFRNGFK